jgi:Tol biopolymer transport system component
MRRSSLLAVLGIAACVFSAGATGRAARPETHGAATQAQLAAFRVVTGNPPRREIVLAGADGQIVRSLTGTKPSPVGWFSWARDGTRLAYAAYTLEHPRWLSDVYVVRPGSEPVRLTTSGRAFAPVWAADGRIVFAETVEGSALPEVGIWVMNDDGSDRRELLHAAQGVMNTPTSFTPDGKLAFTRLTFTGAESGFPFDSSIHTLDLSSGDVSLLAEQASDPAFSPDGGLVAFASYRDRNGSLSYGDFTHPANELYVMNLRSGELRRLTHTRDKNELAPSWSLDGSTIAYQRGVVIDNAEGSVVARIRPDGTCGQTILSNRGLAVWYGAPHWRPISTAKVPCKTAPHAAPLPPLAGNLSLSRAKRLRPRPYWLGRRFEDLVLASLSRSTQRGPRGRGSVVDLYYGAIQVQLWPACIRVPGDVSVPSGSRIRVRGVDAVFFEGGGRLELVTGKTTVVLFGRRQRLIRAVRALRPIGVSTQPRGNLPRPAPGALSGRLRCG